MEIRLLLWWWRCDRSLLSMDRMGCDHIRQRMVLGMDCCCHGCCVCVVWCWDVG
jgi:hypothetical protein